MRLNHSAMQQLTDINFANDTFFFYQPQTDWLGITSSDSTLAIVVPKQITKSTEMMQYVLWRCFDTAGGETEEANRHQAAFVDYANPNKPNWEGFRDLLSWPSIGYDRVLVVHLNSSFDSEIEGYLFGFYWNLSDDPDPGDRQWAVGFPSEAQQTVEAFGYY